MRSPPSGPRRARRLDLALLGRRDDALRIFERLLAIHSDVGLLAEGYHVEAKRLVGNDPQVFSHIGLINTALNLSQTGPTPATDRGSRASPSTRRLRVRFVPAGGD